MIKIRYVQGNDKNFWYSLDKHLSVEEFAKKVANQQDYVLLVDGIGLLKDDFLGQSTILHNALYRWKISEFGIW